MFSLRESYSNKEPFRFGEIKGNLTFAFDNILNFFAVANGDDISDELIKYQTCIQYVTDLDTNTLSKLSNENLVAFFSFLTDEITRSKPTIIPDRVKRKLGNEPYYDLEKDADYIYASFMQDYGIDLFEQQGKLHWYKFSALLAGLSDETKFKQVIGIRATDLKDIKDKKERANIHDQQVMYSLKTSDEEIRFKDMDLLEQEEYMKNKYREEDK